jgi:hypothetical protein
LRDVSSASLSICFFFASASISALNLMSNSRCAPSGSCRACIVAERFVTLSTGQKVEARPRAKKGRAVEGGMRSEEEGSKSR